MERSDEQLSGAEWAMSELQELKLMVAPCASSDGGVPVLMLVPSHAECVWATESSAN